MKIHDVKRPGGDQSAGLTFNDINQISNHVDAPLVNVCRDLFLKNVQTYYSSCNSNGEKTETIYTALGIDANSLSNENLNILKKLMKKYPKNFQEDLWYSDNYIGKGNIPNIMIKYEFLGGTDTEVISKKYESIGKKFVQQEKIINNGHYKEATNEEYMDELNRRLSIIQTNNTKLSDKKQKTLSDDWLDNWNPLTGEFTNASDSAENSSSLNEAIEKYGFNPRTGEFSDAIKEISGELPQIRKHQVTMKKGMKQTELGKQ